MKKKHLIIALILYVLSAAGSYTVFSSVNPSQPVTDPNQPREAAEGEVETELGLLLDIDPSASKDQPCPLNGAYYTQAEKDAWSKRRPLFVMIENSPDARPQSGLSKADVVFEAVAEGGVTRFGAVYYCAAQKKDVIVAPVRSARTYFVDYASGFYRPMYAHVGGANLPGPTDALGQIGDYGWELQNDITAFSEGYPTFVRNKSRIKGKQLATEHTMETSTELLWDVAEKRDWTNINPITEENWLEEYQGWAFEEEPADTGEISQVSYEFWSGYDQYAVDWEYDSQKDAFLRSQGGEEHIDLNTGERIAAANVVVLQTTEKGPINELKHMIYGTTGTGDAYIFKHGDVIEANWSKASRISELEFTDGRGQPVELARGLTWISVVNLSTEPDYE